MVRLTRQEQSEANRKKILTSARDHFERSGYHDASVDGIAEAAGFSKGAVYSQFGSKDELMLAVLEASIEQRQRASDQLAQTLGPDAHIEQVMRDAFAVSLNSSAWQAALTEFRIHAWRTPELNDRYQTLHQRTIDKVASILDRILDRFDPADRPSSQELATAVLAANTGLVIESFVGGELDIIDVIQVLGSALQAQPVQPKEHRDEPHRNHAALD